VGQLSKLPYVWFASWKLAPVFRIHRPKCVDEIAGAMRLASFMRNSDFRVVALPTNVAEVARKAAAQNRPDHRVVMVNSPKAAPCRHCLRWAEPGEHVILFPYNAVPVGQPYSETGPIFVHAQPCQRYAAEHEYPAQFRHGRAFRAYNSTDDLIEAILPNGDEPEAVIEKLLNNPETAFVHARSASHGCYTFQIERR
jgi:hypothetical protein